VLALTRLGPDERRVVAAFDDAVLAPFLGAGATFERAIAEQRLFVADYAALGEITADATAPGWQAGRKLIAPIALFVRTDRSANLEPVGIDLGPNRTFLAQRERTAGNDDRWAIAKMFVQSADYNYNQVVNHLAFTHLIEESICLAVYRRLAPQHPVTRLLARHFTALLAINQIGVFTLISKNGIIAHILEGGLGGSLQLIANAYRNWSFDDLDFPAQIARRGLGDPTFLPYYPYRDDGMLIWNLIGEYVEQYVALYYGNDDAVASDYELQGFAQQLGGLLDGGAGGLTGFPAEIVSCAQLCTVLRRIIWTAGPQHAAVNYPQIDFATFVPNLPAATYAPPPEAGADVADLTAWLPPQAETQTQVHTGYSLAGMHYDRFLRYRLCRADGSQALVDQFHARLVHDVRPVIVARNAERARTPGQLTYPYFLPENIPNSTSV
jgi:arachidonate 15-lipoxygenase